MSSLPNPNGIEAKTSNTVKKNTTNLESFMENRFDPEGKGGPSSLRRRQEIREAGHQDHVGLLAHGT